MILDKVFRGRIHHGSLVVELPDGESVRYGEGQPQARMQIHDTACLKRIATDPEFMLGQAYMDQAWSSPDLLGLLEVLIQNIARDPVRGWRRLAKGLLRPLQQWNRREAAQRNVAHHYDIEEWIFRRFLDEDMQYSCAYWPRADISLEQAQLAKKEHIRRKLCLESGQHVLDIGCGWGGLAMYLARHNDVSVTGLTLSREQHRLARQRVHEQGLDDRVEIRMADYRDVCESYDRVVSVGMFEHVGTQFYDTYFGCIDSLLTADGVALVHTIGRNTPPGLTNPWIRRYIFPGGYIPAMSEVLSCIERCSMLTTDVEVLRLHYAKTLSAWQQRFQQIRATVAGEKGETFCRMWEFYLAVSEAAFLWREMVVFQFQLARDQQAVPLTRDYLHDTPTLADATIASALHAG
jgi:cyclopropane-fatty-acyl-phospholipid synthase